MKIFIIILFCVTLNMVLSDPEIAMCCHPARTVLSDDGYNCTNIDTNVTTPTDLLCEKRDIVAKSSLDFQVSDEGQLIVEFNGLRTYVDHDK